MNIPKKIFGNFILFLLMGFCTNICSHITILHGNEKISKIEIETKTKKENKNEKNKILKF